MSIYDKLSTDEFNKALRVIEDGKGYFLGSLNSNYYKVFGKSDDKYAMVHCANGRWWITLAQSEDDFSPNDAEEVSHVGEALRFFRFFDDWEFVEE